MAIEGLKKKIKYGDYNTLAEMLSTTVAAVKMQIKREEANAIQALSILIETREKMISNFQKKYKVGDKLR